MRGRRGRREEEKGPFGKGSSRGFTVLGNEAGEVISVEVVGINNSLLDGRRKGISIRVICGEMSHIEFGVKGICSELDATWSHGIFEDRDKMMLFARVGIHLGLLGDASGI